MLKLINVKYSVGETSWNNNNIATCLFLCEEKRSSVLIIWSSRLQVFGLFKHFAQFIHFKMYSILFMYSVLSTMGFSADVVDFEFLQKITLVSCDGGNILCSGGQAEYASTIDASLRLYVVLEGAVDSRRQTGHILGLKHQLGGTMAGRWRTT